MASKALKVVDHEASFDFESNDGKFGGFAKWDGCVEFDYRIFDEASDVQRMHVCDVDDLIERLTALRERMRERF
jgi:hypothetical protein